MTNAPEPPDGATMIAPTPRYDGPAGAGQPGPAPSYAPDVQRARDRVWSLRTVAAAAITAVALSGAGGAALAAAGNGSGSQGFGPGGQPGRGGFPGQFRQFHQGQAPGQLPPATTSPGGRDT